jgi:hypothetical protein
MPLNFSNPSRDHVAARNGVRFWGYDRSLEVHFLVTESALLGLHSKSGGGQAGFLDIFDAHRDRIHVVAHEVYARGFAGSQTLGHDDFLRSPSGRH